jgi:hypothetical protein
VDPKNPSRILVLNKDMEQQVIDLTTPKPKRREGLLKKGWNAMRAAFGWMANKLNDFFS